MLSKIGREPIRGNADGAHARDDVSLRIIDETWSE